MRKTDTSLIECPECRTRYNPEFSVSWCPHVTMKGKEPAGLAQLRAAGPPYKKVPSVPREEWKPEEPTSGTA